MRYLFNFFLLLWLLPIQTDNVNAGEKYLNNFTFSQVEFIQIPDTQQTAYLSEVNSQDDLANLSSEEMAKYWIEKAESSETPDFTIAHKLIKLVTKNKFKDYYEKSSEIYYWGLQTRDFNEEIREALFKEVRYLESIFGFRKTKILKKMIEENNPEIFTFLEQFWNSKSLSPSDEYNERLLEHWERINYARENFKTSRRHEFDDRGDIYIRFGEPSKSRSGFFMYNPAFVNYLVGTRMDDGRGAGSAMDNTSSTTSYLNTIYRVRDYHQYPSYEVWLYDELRGEQDEVIYLFGNNYGGKEMKLKQSVDDFIPSAAYSSTNRNSAYTMNFSGQNMPSSASSEEEEEASRENSDVVMEDMRNNVGNSESISPAIVLQLMYYRQLTNIDFYFSSRYNQMMNRYMDVTMPLSSSLARQFQQTSTAKLINIQEKAPEDNSSNNNYIFDLSLDIHTYQFFDEDLKPYLRVYFSEELDEAITFDGLKATNSIQEIDINNYELLRTIRLISENTEISDSIIKKEETINTDSSNTLNSNVFEVPYTISDRSLKMYTELHRKKEEDKNSISENSTLRKSLIGSGTLETEIDHARIKEHLFASDFIIGYKNENSEPGQEFRVTHNKVIPKGQNLMLYYEAYNIPRDSTGLHAYTLTSKIKKDRNWLGRLFTLNDKGETSITIYNTSESSQFSQMLEIQSEQLDEGEYILEVELSSINPNVVREQKEIKLKVE